jgi:Rad3-related DNA helicase
MAGLCRLEGSAAGNHAALKAFAALATVTHHESNMSPDHRITRHPSSRQRIPFTVIGVLGPDGLLAQADPGYEDRPGQVRMAEVSRDAISQASPVAIQAATGVGKSIAYLVAALCAGEKVIVSTNSKVLQSQLKEKDLPYLQHHLAANGHSFSFAVLKGKSNYLCLHELKKAQDDLDDGLFGFHDRESAAAWDPLIDWLAAEREANGLADLDYAPMYLTSELRERITTDSDHCLGKQCPFVKQCFAERAKAQAKTADVLVVNHHLLLTDLKLREPGGSCLPAREVIILDEAHTLESVATAISAVTLTVTRWRRLAQRSRVLAERLTSVLNAEPVDMTPDSAEALLRAMDREDTKILQQAIDETVTAGAGAQSEAEYQFQTWLNDLGDEQKIAVVGHAQHLVEATSAWTRAMTHVAGRLEQWRWAEVGGTETANVDEPESHVVVKDWLKLVGLVDRLGHDLQQCLQDEPNWVRFLEKVEGRYPRAVLQRCMIHVGPWLHQVLWAPFTTVSCSATLTTYQHSVGHTFSYWMDRVGHPPTETLRIESPFNYCTHCLIYLPSPAEAFEPLIRQCGEGSQSYQDRSAAYYTRLADEIVMLLQASRGRALVLFTSGSSMRRVADLVRPEIQWPLLVQGELERLTLLETFRETISSVLFATKSFWQGVDIAGESLSLLVIDKLPFDVPNDPLVRARCDDVKRRHGPGKEWEKLIIPSMITWVHQAFGRLIRRGDDRGVVAILDGRVQTKAYGAATLKSLPPARQARSFSDVQRFFGEEARDD